MARWRFWCVAGLMLALAHAGPAGARACLGVDFPDSVREGGAPLVLNGLGVRRATFLGIKVYVAALYLKRPAGNPQAALAEVPPGQLVLRFVRGVGAARIREAWQQGFADNSGPALPTLQPRITTLNGWMRDVKDGEDMVFAFTPPGVAVSIGGITAGTIPGEDFARALLAIWLGPRPPART